MRSKKLNIARIILFAMAIGTLWLGGVQGVQARLKVVTSSSTLAAITAEVGGSLVDVEALASASQDPHFVDPRPNLILKLNKADLLVANGMELELGWLPKLQVSARNADILVGNKGYLDASTLVQALDVPVKADRSMGDVHPSGNPHYHFDARAGAGIALGIGEKLATLDPANRATYLANARRLSDKLKQFATRQTERFGKLPPSRRQVVSYHKSFVYLYAWLGLREAITVEPRPGISPDPGHVAKVLKRMKGDRIKVILQEEFYPDSTSKTLARLAQATLITVPGGVNFKSGQSYLEYLEGLTEALHEALR